MATLAIDIETYSSIDLMGSGVYAYTSAPDFTILLFAYAFDDEPVQIIDIASGEEIPSHILVSLQDPEVVKTAFNANFERTCISKFLGIELPPEQWRCTAVHALTLGLPGYLAGVAKTLKVKQQKMDEGKALIRFFCTPAKKSKAAGELFKLDRNLPEQAPSKWETFKKYCKQDVEAERAVRQALLRFPVPESEQSLWVVDQEINDRGVRVDQDLVAHAIICDQEHSSKLEAEAKELTGLNNPSSPAQLKAWLKETDGLEVESLNKKAVVELIEQTDCDTIRRALELRQQLAKTSVKKYEAIERSVCPDGRTRGLFQFYGARTGRWAGRLVQVQNLPQNKLEDLDLARDLLHAGDYESIELLFATVPGVLSQLIRTAFIPSEGCRFIVSDFSAIEARVIAWLAGEQWRMDVFNSHGKIYEASAAQMFKVPIDSIDKGSSLRQKGKVAELALGYQGAKGALIQMGALDMGLTEDELPELVNSWRQSNPNIVKFWRDVEQAAIAAVQDKVTTDLQYGLSFTYKSGLLFIRLPSGRSLAYARPKIDTNKFGKPCISYEGKEEGNWGRLQTYGGKLVENIVQAVARDCLGVSMLRLAARDYKIVMHVHDEVVLDVPIGQSSADAVAMQMGEPIDWAPGLPLRADAFETNYYKKD